MIKSICIHCQKNIENLDGSNLWYADSEITPQYCFIDPVNGSRLHEPPPGVLTVKSNVLGLKREKASEQQPGQTLEAAFEIIEAQWKDKETYLRLLTGYLGEFIDTTSDFMQEVGQMAPVIFDQRFMNPFNPLRCFLAKSYGVPVGFVVINVHDFNWSLKKRCYIEDLYVDPFHRKQGHATSLLEHVFKMKEKHDWCQVYWTTEKGNVKAQSLYDKVAQRTSRIIYESNSIG